MITIWLFVTYIVVMVGSNYAGYPKSGLETVVMTTIMILCCLFLGAVEFSMYDQDKKDRAKWERKGE